MHTLNMTCCMTLKCVECMCFWSPGLVVLIACAVDELHQLILVPTQLGYFMLSLTDSVALSGSTHNSTGTKISLVGLGVKLSNLA